MPGGYAVPLLFLEASNCVLWTMAGYPRQKRGRCGERTMPDASWRFEPILGTALAFLVGHRPFHEIGIHSGRIHPTSVPSRRSISLMRMEMEPPCENKACRPHLIRLVIPEKRTWGANLK